MVDFSKLGEHKKNPRTYAIFLGTACPESCQCVRIRVGFHVQENKGFLGLSQDQGDGV